MNYVLTNIANIFFGENSVVKPLMPANSMVKKVRSKPKKEHRNVQPVRSVGFAPLAKQKKEHRKGHNSKPVDVRKKKNYYDASKEDIIQGIVELLTGKKFHTVRPPWLKNPSTNRPLEIDLYNEELDIGFEYNSRIHYVYDEHIHKTKAKFEQMQGRDQLKLILANEHGTKLVIVPYWLPNKDLPRFLKKELKGYIK